MCMFVDLSVKRASHLSREPHTIYGQQSGTVGVDVLEQSIDNGGVIAR